jgi:hypothetical protein
VTDVGGIHRGRLAGLGMNDAEDGRMADLARYILRLFAATFLPVLTLCLLASVEHRHTPALRHVSG